MPHPLITQSDIDAYRRDGFVVVESFLDAGEVERAPILDSLLTKYSLGSGETFTWVP